MASSVFMRPRARAAMSSVAQQQVFREVHTEDELRAAVFSETPGAYVFGTTGRRVVIASPISVKSPIIINAHGTTIESHGKIPIFPNADSLDCIFNISTGVNITIRNLMFSNTGGFIEPTYCVKLGNLNSMKDCTVVTGNTGVLVGTDSFVSGNQFFFAGGAFLSGSFSIITQNMVTGGIVSDVTSSGVVISLNSMFGSNIDTSLSGGGNTIVGNANVGTITNAATDAVTSNT